MAANPASFSPETPQQSIADQIEKIEYALTAKQVATFLQVSERLIYQQAKRGQLPSFKIGDARRFDPKIVARWLRKQ